MATVPYPKIWSSGEVLTAADLNAEFAAVNSISGIAGSALLPQAIDTAQLKDAATTTAKVADAAITSAKLIDGATAIHFITTLGSAVTIGTADTIVLSQAFTNVRTRLRVTATFGGAALFTADGGVTLTPKIKVDTNPVYAGPPVSFGPRTADGSVTQPVSITAATIITLAAGAHTFDVTLVKDIANGTFSVTAVITIEEIA